MGLIIYIYRNDEIELRLRSIQSSKIIVLGVIDAELG